MGPMLELTGMAQIAQMGPRRGPCRYIWGICGHIPVCPDEADALIYGQILIIGRLSPDCPDGAQKGPVMKLTGTYKKFVNTAQIAQTGPRWGPCQY